MTFSRALDLLKRGSTVKRRIWPDAQWLIYMVGYSPIITLESRYARVLEGTGKTEMHLPILPRVDMHTEEGMRAGWLPNHEEMLAGDWEELS